MWTTVGLGTQKECQCPTGQGGCPCVRSTDCLSDCIAQPKEIGIHGCDGLCAGTCSPVSKTVGCWCFFGGDGRTNGTICVD